MVRLNQSQTDSFISPVSGKGRWEDDIEFLRFSFMILAEKRQRPVAIWVNFSERVERASTSLSDSIALLIHKVMTGGIPTRCHLSLLQSQHLLSDEQGQIGTVACKRHHLYYIVADFYFRR